MGDGVMGDRGDVDLLRIICIGGSNYDGVGVSQPGANHASCHVPAM